MACLGKEVIHVFCVIRHTRELHDCIFSTIYIRAKLFQLLLLREVTSPFIQLRGFNSLTISYSSEGFMKTKIPELPGRVCSLVRE